MRRELQARDRQHHQAPDDRDHRAQRDRQADAGDGLHQRGVGGQARQHLAGARDLEEGRVHADHARVHGRAQVGDDALAEPGDEVEAQRGKHAEHCGGRQEREEIAVDGVGAAGRHALVDQVAQRHRQREHRGRGHQQCDERQQQDRRGTARGTAAARAAVGASGSSGGRLRWGRPCRFSVVVCTVTHGAIAADSPVAHPCADEHRSP